MSISLIVTRRSDTDDEASSDPITREEWCAVIEEEPDLELRTAPHEAINPRTGEKLCMPAGDLEAQLKTSDGVVAFLSFFEGELCMRYQERMDCPSDPVRRKVLEVAGRLGARVTNDAGPESYTSFDW